MIARVRVEICNLRHPHGVFLHAHEGVLACIRSSASRTDTPMSCLCFTRYKRGLAL